MKTVVVFAANLKVGDVFAGQRIKAVHTYGRRCRKKGSIHKLAQIGVMLIAPSRSGNELDVFDAVGDDRIKVKRPKYNMTK